MPESSRIPNLEPGMLIRVIVRELPRHGQGLASLWRIFTADPAVASESSGPSEVFRSRASVRCEVSLNDELIHLLGRTHRFVAVRKAPRRYLVPLRRPELVSPQSATVSAGLDRRKRLDEQFEGRVDRLVHELEALGPVVRKETAGLELAMAAGGVEAEPIVVRALPALNLMLVSGPPQAAEILTRPGAPSPVDITEIKITLPDAGSPRGPSPSTEAALEPWHLRNLPAFVPMGTGPRPSVGIGFADTGISGDVVAAEFAGRAPRFAEFSSRGSKVGTLPKDVSDDGHGSGVVTLAAGSRRGIAPDASVAVAQCFRKDRTADPEQIIEGLSWLVETLEAQNPLGLNLINCSFGIVGAAGVEPTETFRSIVETLLERRIGLVAAVGNYGPGQMVCPGSYPEVIAVGALDRDAKLYANCCYGYGPSGRYFKPDFVAPGQDVVTLDARARPVLREGTSFASPLVVGLAARAFQARPGFAITSAIQADIRGWLTSLGTPLPIGQAPHGGTTRRLL